jgi:hypothetical protein
MQYLRGLRIMEDLLLPVSAKMCYRQPHVATYAKEGLQIKRTRSEHRTASGVIFSLLTFQSHCRVYSACVR